MAPRHFAEELPESPVERARFLQQFAGSWIALDENHVIAAAQTLDDLYRRLDDIGKPMATVQRIPDPSLGVFVG